MEESPLEGARADRAQDRLAEAQTIEAEEREGDALRKRAPSPMWDWVREEGMEPIGGGRDGVAELARARLGTVLRGKYRLDEIIGFGGMAVVYKATHRNQARFAVKMLHPALSLREDIRARFLREGYAANSIRHAGGVFVVDDDVAEDGAAFLVMELLEGVSCEALCGLPDARVPVDVATAILIQILDVLAAAHANGVLHRDIKPENVFLTRGGVVKVLDFGIARTDESAKGGANMTVDGAPLGTPAFMAPEQALGRTAEVDVRSDLWSAAATFFKLVGGGYVHVGEGLQEIFALAATRPARPISDVADVPPPIAAIVDRALQFRREDRWPSAVAMRDALLECVPGDAASRELLIAWAVASCEGPASQDAKTHFQPIAASKSKAKAVESSAGAFSVPSVAPPRGGQSASRRLSWGVAGAATVVALAVAALVFGSRSSGEAERGGGAPPNAAALGAAAPPRVAEAEPRAPLPAPAASDLPAALVQDSGAAGAPEPASSLTEAHPAKSAPPAAGPRRHKPPTECDPPFVLDDQGRKHFKRECYLNP